MTGSNKACSLQQSMINHHPRWSLYCNHFPSKSLTVNNRCSGRCCVEKSYVCRFLNLIKSRCNSTTLSLNCSFLYINIYTAVRQNLRCTILDQASKETKFFSAEYMQASWQKTFSIVPEKQWPISALCNSLSC